MNNKLNPMQMNALLNMASKQLGTDPAALKAKLEQGKLNELTQHMSPQQVAGLNQILSNPQAMNELLNSPQARELMKRLTGGK